MHKADNSLSPPRLTAKTNTKKLKQLNIEFPKQIDILLIHIERNFARLNILFIEPTECASFVIFLLLASNKV